MRLLIAFAALLALMALCDAGDSSVRSAPQSLPPPTSPSPSCASFRSCKKDRFFLQEAENFVAFARRTYPDANVPKAKELLKYSCSLLDPEPRNGHKREALERIHESRRPHDDEAELSLNDWFKNFFDFSYWDTQEGMMPYRNPVRPPFWWCFLADDVVYTAGPSFATIGRQAVINSFAGLGFPTTNDPLTNGAGFYVSFVNVTDTYSVLSPRPGIEYSQSFVIKELTNINFGLSPPGTVKPKDQYQLFTTFELRDGCRLVVTRLQETIDTFATIVWAGLCPALCPSS